MEVLTGVIISNGTSYTWAGFDTFFVGGPGDPAMARY